MPSPAASERREKPVLTNVKADRVRSVAGLSRRSARDKSGLTLVEGPQSVRELVACAPESIRDLYLSAEGERRYREIVQAARSAGVYVHLASDEVLAAMADATTSQHLIAVASWAPAELEDVLAHSPQVLVFCTNLRDPGNAGTIIRAADAAGADAVLISDNSVEINAPKVIRSSAGSLFHLPIVTGLEIGSTLARLAQAKVTTYAADGTAAMMVTEVDLRQPHCWVMGNEAWGLPAEVQDACADKVALPLHGRAESLNVAMAATLFLYSSAQQRPTLSS